MATAKKPAGAAKTRSTSTKTSAGAKKAPAKSGSAAPSKAAATAKAPASKSAAKSAAKTATKTAAKTAAKSVAKAATKTAAKTATKTAAKSGATAAKKAPSKAAAGKRGPNPAFMKPLQPDAQLAEVVGNDPMPRTQVVARVWDYIKKNGLQESRNIKADEKLRPIFGKEQITMFEMMKLVNAHLSDVSA